MAEPRPPGDEVWRVLIADDQRMFADAIVRVVEGETDMTVVGVVESVEELRTRMGGQAPSILLLDYRFADGDALEVLPDLVKSWPDAKFVLVTGYASSYTFDGAIAGGCHAVISKSQRADEVIDVMRTVLAGRRSESTRRSTRLLQSSLSTRELQVLGLVAESASTTQIAARLSISPTTTRNHIQSILRKLNASSQLEAVVIASGLGLVNVSGAAANEWPQGGDETL